MSVPEELFSGQSDEPYLPTKQKHFNQSIVFPPVNESKDNNDQIEKFVNNFSEYFAGYKKKEQEKVKKNNAEF